MELVRQMVPHITAIVAVVLMVRIVKQTLMIAFRPNVSTMPPALMVSTIIAAIVCLGFTVPFTGKISMNAGTVLVKTVANVTIILEVTHVIVLQDTQVGFKKCWFLFSNPRVQTKMARRWWVFIFTHYCIYTTIIKAMKKWLICAHNYKTQHSALGNCFSSIQTVGQGREGNAVC